MASEVILRIMSLAWYRMTALGMLEIIHEHVGLGDCVCSGGGLLRGEFIESMEDTRVAGSAIIEESTAD